MLSVRDDLCPGWLKPGIVSGMLGARISVRFVDAP